MIPATPEELMEALTRAARACGWRWDPAGEQPDHGVDDQGWVWIDDKLCLDREAT